MKLMSEQQAFQILALCTMVTSTGNNRTIYIEQSKNMNIWNFPIIPFKL